MIANKEQVQARLRAIEDGLRTLNDEAAALRSIIEAPEPVEKKPLVQAKDELGYGAYHRQDGYKTRSEPDWCNSFATQSQAEAYSEAFNTLLDLRRQPGCEAAENGKDQWYINPEGNIKSWWHINKVMLICPAFDSKDSALAAREAVGWDRIMRMYNTLHGRGYE